MKKIIGLYPGSFDPITNDRAAVGPYVVYVDAPCPAPRSPPHTLHSFIVQSQSPFPSMLSRKMGFPTLRRQAYGRVSRRPGESPNTQGTYLMNEGFGLQKSGPGPHFSQFF